MTICSVNEISKMFGGNKIFENLSFEINEGDRVGLVGRNGTGKTSLFKLMAGYEAVDEGQIHFKKGTKIGYLPQIPEFPQGFTARDVLNLAFKDVKVIEEELRKLEREMGSEKPGGQMERILEKYGLLQERFAFLGGYEMEANIASIVNGLQINALVEQDFLQLSGGEKTKVCLGYLLLQKPDLLLLDEPTNHLDIGAVEWLEQYLNDYAGTIIIISHDRYFLDEVVTRILDLEDGEITLYHHNYSGFVKEKEERLLVEFQAYQEQQKKIKKMKEAIKRLKEWANRANPPNEGLHKRARNMERALERMDKLKRPVLERKKMNLQLDAADRSGKEVLMIKDGRKAFPDKVLFEDLQLQVQYLDRAAIIGENGTGKSTIIKVLLGDLPLDGGEAKIGSNVKIGYLSQHHVYHDSNASLIDVFRDEVSVTEGDARHILAKFLFYGHSVFRKVGSLSGGERMRLRLAQLMHQDVNVLILDEPTNHLDIDSREVLEDTLEDFEGTILAVSHDRYFLNKLFDKTYCLKNRKLHFFDGGYEWAKKKLQEMSENEDQVKEVKQQKPVLESKPVKKEEIKIDPAEIEKKLEEVEGELAKIQNQMLAETDLDLLQTLYERQQEKEAEKEALYSQWEEVI
ncbi:ribosomal protection-like ABC-F family protein [Falsibacillus pallidus]|uniref:ATPase subunit of ABC transporter with duplicated ATPase domains n=1 Tax=Falsibacillus pallidus TaxID=493781 RepID=A0A370GGM6_9BACI|nr:ABC-F type ribosomal protection protein [Falsibacillus pallidus]RDI42279.1 ATPase subunit of ABC transporter with duplicated ATPase domains [Falsibacillus pallidus]